MQLEGPGRKNLKFEISNLRFHQLLFFTRLGPFGRVEVLRGVFESEEPPQRGGVERRFRRRATAQLAERAMQDLIDDALGVLVQDTLSLIRRCGDELTERAAGL